MDVKTLCLGLLAEGDACGYELKKKFEAEFKPFFPAGYGSIYPALGSLAAEGLVECELEPQQGRPDRKTYRLTESGRRRFEQALRNSRPRHKLRSELLATLYFAEMLAPERIEQLLADHLRELSGTVAHIESIENARDGEYHPGAAFVAGFGCAVTEAAAEYIRTHGRALIEGRGRRRGNDERGTQPAATSIESRA